MKNLGYKYHDTSVRIIDYIKNHRLLPGSRLPSIRTLAHSFNISKDTVIKALEHLHDRQEIVLKEKSGAYVASGAWAAESGLELWQSYHQPPPPAGKAFSSHMEDVAKYKLYLGTAKLAEEFNSEKYMAMAVKDLYHYIKSSPVLHGIRAGHGVENALCSYLNNKGIEVSPEMLTLTSGSNSSINYILKTFFKRGMYLLIEEPSSVWFYAYQLAEELGGTVVSVKMDDEGITLEELRNPRYRKKAILLVSSVHQYPTGISMSEQRKRDLLDICREMQIAVVEQDNFSDGFDIRSLKAMDTNDIVIYAGSLRHTFALGFNIGWIAVPEYLSKKVLETKHRMDIYNDNISAALLEILISNNYYYDFLDQFRPLFRKRKEYMDNLICQYLGDRVSWNPGHAGFLYWLDFGDIPIKKVFDEMDVYVTDGGLFSSSCKNHVSLCPLAVTEPELERVVQQLTAFAYL